MLGGIVDGGPEAGGRLGVYHYGFGSFVDQFLDLLVLQAGVRRGQERAYELDVHLLGIRRLVLDVGGPERRVVIGEVDAYRGCEAALTFGAASAVLGLIVASVTAVKAAMVAAAPRTFAVLPVLTNVLPFLWPVGLCARSPGGPAYFGRWAASS